MPKSEIVRVARRRALRRTPAELPDAVEGPIAEISRDLAVQLKRVRQMQEQVDELRLVIREWASQSQPILAGETANRHGRR